MLLVAAVGSDGARCGAAPEELGGGGGPLVAVVAEVGGFEVGGGEAGEARFAGSAVGCGGAGGAGVGGEGEVEGGEGGHDGVGEGWGGRYFVEGKLGYGEVVTVFVGSWIAMGSLWDVVVAVEGYTRELYASTRVLGPEKRSRRIF